MLTTSNSNRLISSSSLSGTSVRNLDKKDIGTIKDLMVDLRSGRIAYAVLSFGGFMGLGEKLFAIPFEAFRLDTDEEELILDAKKEVLEESEGFDSDNWPDFADARFHQRVHSAFQTQPTWQMAKS